MFYVFVRFKQHVYCCWTAIGLMIIDHEIVFVWLDFVRINHITNALSCNIHTLSELELIHTVCSTFILHFQQAFWGSSGWVITKSFEHDKVDNVQIFIWLKNNYSHLRIFVRPTRKDMIVSPIRRLWKWTKSRIS